MFVGEYPLITKDELNLFHSFSSAILHIDKSKVTIDNCNFIWEYCNQDNRTAEECQRIFDHLFNDVDEDVIKSIFYSLDFDKIKLCQLSTEEKENCLELIADAIDISSSDHCIQCMKHLKDLIPSLERIIQINGYNREYIVLLNDLSIYTTSTVEWLGTTSLNDAISPVLSDALLDNKYYKNYIIGKSLFDNKLCFNLNILDIEEYIKLYLTKDCLYDIMSRNIEFLENAANSEVYEEIEQREDIKYILPFHQIKQTIDMIKLVFGFGTQKEIHDYILSVSEIATQDDSIAIQKFLCEEENMELLGDYKLKEKIDYLLWSSHKTHKRTFNSAWNKRWKKLRKQTPEFLD